MILVTGATGYVGRHVVKALADTGEKVRCLVRNTKDANLPGVELVHGDVTDQVSLAVACTGVDTVIHLVAIIREGKGITFEDINIKGTQNLLSAAKESKVKHFVHISALGANTNPKYKYAYSKGVAEVEVVNSGLKYTVLRPSVIFGPGFGFVDRLLQTLRMMPTVVALPGDGSVKFQPIWVKDVAECIVRVIENQERYKNKIIDIGGPEHLTYEQMLDILMEVTGIKKAKIPVPMPLVHIAAKFMQYFMEDPPVTTVELAQLDTDNITDIHAVKKHFGFTPTRYADGLEYIKYKLKNEQKRIEKKE
ncbi:NADH dehydrogenase [Desulfohalotomaculum tongense]|uniref:complex I NDUFA9 subunit family protein n=1 Tax=Desulforadius tongensis TaxID=1216062 RepID=UPI0019569031|nr:complex I NDUFA9 subunit family protein [Desulforadius tongensis]MBM7856016.1 NADH dehydrogenase [Desulforadius tongensis]